MTEPSSGDDSPRRPVLVPAVGLVLATGLGITALLGGLNEVPDPNPPQYSNGQELDQGRFKTQFVEAREVVQKPRFTGDEAKRFLELVFKVTNQGKETARVGMPPAKLEGAFALSSFAGSLVKVSPSLKQQYGPYAYAVSKGVQSQQLQPGVTTTVIVRYDLLGDAPAPEKVTLDVASFEWKPGFNDPSFAWQMVADEVDDAFFPEVKARITLDVKGRGSA
ncbi:hypothetical protein [Nonomuraea dietziae]|uniref:Uncharacterized protein n=1 Tax=Nonomuraea dietziae TaxID=65515 RepID=A0A7W5Y8R7_9ACTN|nr:hypothetical protein [Nonomuraea dietziae]MBB3728841.1 hypothetical protein [Nonomuraea dietziae]